MKVEKKEMIQKGREAAKKSLEEDGWQILLENKNIENPLDFRAVKGNDVIICHLSYHSVSSDPNGELKERLRLLKKKALKTNAFPFSIEVFFTDEGSVKDVLYHQVI
jgi:hypothetical protein